MYAEERRLHILELLKRKKRVGVADLAEKLDISAETVRRDLNEMEADGFLKRTHGGAIYIGENISRPPIPLFPRRKMHPERKTAIARVAAQFVEDGDVVALDNSTTVFAMLEFIPQEFKITIITYSLQVAMDVAGRPDCAWTCICLGGVLRVGNLSTHGFITNNALGFFQPRKLFLSCAGLDAKGCLTEGSLTDAETKRELIACCSQKFLLMDASKWRQAGIVNEGNAADLDYLVTNADAPRDAMAFLRDKKVRVLLDDNTSPFSGDEF